MCEMSNGPLLMGPMLAACAPSFLPRAMPIVWDLAIPGCAHRGGDVWRRPGRTVIGVVRTNRSVASVDRQARYSKATPRKSFLALRPAVAAVVTTTAAEADSGLRALLVFACACCTLPS